MGRGRKYILTTAAGNIGFAASYWIFPQSYRFYRIQKRLFNAAFRHGAPVVEEPQYSPDTVVIQGFRHSGNLFIESNVVTEDRYRIPNVRHRPWIVKSAVEHGLPVVMLIRHPKDVAASAVYRTTNDHHPNQPFRIYPWAVLCAWIGYYRSVMRFRQSLHVLPLDLIASDYAACSRAIKDRTGVRMNADPNWDRVNRYSGDRWELHLSWLSQLLLRKAEAIYHLLVSCSVEAPASSKNGSRPASTT